MTKLVLSNSKSLAKIQHFPATHGITTENFINFNNRQNSEETQKNLLLMKTVKGNSFYKAITRHEAKIIQVNLNGQIDNYFIGDALFCFRPKNNSRPVLITNTADCPIVFMTDVAENFVGIIHSGRQETEMNIVGKTIAKLGIIYDIQASEIIIGIWPGICQYCYPINLQKIIIGQLLEAGINGLDIHTAKNTCSAHSTYKNEFLFSSFRREKSENRNAAFITF
ncbi:MAG: polyphenol oxidase family protein [Patescibacteria group bacterium]|nr:polyphenol oxidase family protein [Patescibacteria group bacterium]